MNACTLAHPDPQKILCLFTDASDEHWSAVLTQIPVSHLNEEVVDQRHEPLSFLSGSFTGSMANWSTPDKETYAIIAACGRLEFFLLRPEVFFYLRTTRTSHSSSSPALSTPQFHVMSLQKLSVGHWHFQHSSTRSTIFLVTLTHGQTLCPAGADPRTPNSRLPHLMLYFRHQSH